MTYLKKALLTTSRARPSTGKENRCPVSGIWDVGFFVSKNEWKKQNLGKEGDQAVLPVVPPPVLPAPLKPGGRGGSHSEEGVDTSQIWIQHPSLGTKTHSRLCDLNQVTPSFLQTRVSPLALQ